MTDPITILQAAELPPAAMRALRDAFHVVEWPVDPRAAAAVLAEHGDSIRGIAARGVRIDAAMLDRLPALEIVSSYSAGLDGIDLAVTAARGIVVRNTSHILAEDVADLAVALTLAVTRGLVRGHAFVRAGRWPSDSFPLGRSLRSLHTGIVGLGHIGMAIARRLTAMAAPIGYCGPHEKPVEHRYFADIAGLAEWSDVLIVSCPVTPATVGLVDGAVLEKLGPRGSLINVARGAIVDEPALMSALARGGLTGAGLDVFADEPHVPAALRDDPRVVLSPHMGSGTEETRLRMADSTVAALIEHFRGR